jgi:hypothetical protein
LQASPAFFMRLSTLCQQVPRKSMPFITKIAGLGKSQTGDFSNRQLQPGDDLAS